MTASIGNFFLNASSFYVSFVVPEISNMTYRGRQNTRSSSWVLRLFVIVLQTSTQIRRKHVNYNLIKAFIINLSFQLKYVSKSSRQGVHYLGAFLTKMIYLFIKIKFAIESISHNVILFSISSVLSSGFSSSRTLNCYQMVFVNILA